MAVSNGNDTVLARLAVLSVPSSLRRFASFRFETATVSLPAPFLLYAPVKPPPPLFAPDGEVCRRALMPLFGGGCPAAGGVVFVARAIHRASFTSAPCAEACAVKIEVADAVLCCRQSQVGSLFQPPARFHRITRHASAAEVVPADGVGGDGFFLVVVIAPVGSLLYRRVSGGDFL